MHPRQQPLHGTDPARAVEAICDHFGRDRTRLMDIALEVQRELGHLDDDTVDRVARTLDIPRVDVKSLVTFYSFLRHEPAGARTIRVCDDVVDRHQGADAVAAAFEDELGVAMGQTTPDGDFHLDWTACIGLSDQAPGVLVDDVPVTDVTPWKARWIVRELRRHGDPRRLVRQLGDGNNAHPLVRSMVRNNVRQPGPVHFDDERAAEAGLHAALQRAPLDVIDEVERSGLRGRGGAGFPTGTKWRLARNAAGGQRYVFCNADEGEPGTFKDRVLLTERPDQVIEGMTIAAWALGASEGIVYLRAEYAYLRPHLEDVLRRRRRRGLLGRAVLGVEDFDFDVRIQMGAGAYVCGEETSLISSCEGLRGDPKDRPPFPVQKGFMGNPTPVNNVETFSCAARILEHGAGWFAGQGIGDMAGTKLYSVCGDCEHPGVYELPFGTRLRDLLERVGATGSSAVCVGGPSGSMVAPSDFDRRLGYGDLSTGGAIICFDATRDPLEIAAEQLDFFIDESCGTCTPCRVGNVVLRERLQDLLDHRATRRALDELQELGETISTMSRCGLGQTSARPVLSTLEHFRDAYTRRCVEAEDRLRPSYDLSAMLEMSRVITGRESSHFQPPEEMRR
jgi:[NiFe] hydrogenase diaphorase moiety large subunit